MNQPQSCGVTFSFTCAQDWDAMAHTGDDGVRHCGTCARDVYLCQSDDEAAAHGAAGRCVALAPRREWDGWTLGEVSPLMRALAAGREDAPSEPERNDSPRRRRRK